MTLRSVSTDDLFYVLDSMHNKEIVAKFGSKYTKELYKSVPQHEVPKINIVSRALFSAITEGPSCSLVILWSIIGLVSLNIISLSILTAGFIVLLLTTAGLFYYSTYRELKRDNVKSTKQMHFALLKLECANELFRRQKYELIMRHLPPQSISAKLFQTKIDKPLKSLYPHLKKSMGATLMVTPMLFGTYYFVTTGILAAFGLTAIAGVLTGPIGIAVAIVAALCIGIFFGCKLYQACKQEELFNKKFIRVNKIVDYKRRICYEQKNKLINNNTVEANEHKPDPVPHNHSCNIKYTRLPMMLINKPVTQRKPLLKIFDNIFTRKNHSSF